MNRKLRQRWLSLRNHDFKASISVFLVALPLCLGIALASGAPAGSGLIAGLAGGLIVSVLSGSQLSVSGPAAGLTAICATAIQDLGAIEMFFLAVALSGIFQVLLGLLKLGGFTHFVPNAVIRGMLAAIGVLLVVKQIPLLLGYRQPDFWSKELVNLLSFSHGFEHVENLYDQASGATVMAALIAIIFWLMWEKFLARKFPFVPVSFLIVLVGVGWSIVSRNFGSLPQFSAEHFVKMPENIFSNVVLPDFQKILEQPAIIKTALVICLVASLETLLSIEAIDKLDPQNRLTPQNRELMAQGAGNTISGIFGGLPVTAVIVRSSANLEAGARSWMSSFIHGIWLIVVVLFGAAIVNQIPFCALAIILVRTGYSLAKPSTFISMWKQGREQFVPFIVTVVAVLVTDLLIGVLIGILYSAWFIFKHTYRAGFTINKTGEGHGTHFTMELALNVSFLNKKKLMEQLDKIPSYSSLEIIGTRSVYIDADILEIVHQFKAKAKNKHIALSLVDIPDYLGTTGH